MSSSLQYSQRKSPRLEGYDYSQNGAYFVTIVTHHRRNLFGHIDKDGIMHLNDFGEIVWSCWNDLPAHYKYIELDAFIVMPNHVHGIILIKNPPDTGVREGFKPSPTLENYKQHGLSEIVRALKTFSSRRINEKRNSSGTPVWQRSFHDRIIRNARELTILREYTLYNPALWTKDRHFTE